MRPLGKQQEILHLLSTAIQKSCFRTGEFRNRPSRRPAWFWKDTGMLRQTDPERLRLVLTERDHRFHRHGTPGRQVTGGEGSQGEDRGHKQIGCRVPHADDDHAADGARYQ
jgi:hypothetical protein